MYIYIYSVHIKSKLRNLLQCYQKMLRNVFYDFSRPLLQIRVPLYYTLVLFVNPCPNLSLSLSQSLPIASDWLTITPPYISPFFCLYSSLLLFVVSIFVFIPSFCCFHSFFLIAFICSFLLSLFLISYCFLFFSFLFFFCLYSFFLLS